jgi:hypothetical protein
MVRRAAPTRAGQVSARLSAAAAPYEALRANQGIICVSDIKSERFRSAPRDGAGLKALR